MTNKLLKVKEKLESVATATGHTLIIRYKDWEKIWNDE